MVGVMLATVDVCSTIILDCCYIIITLLVFADCQVPGGVRIRGCREHHVSVGGE